MSHDATQTPRRTGEPKRWWIAAAITAFVLVVALTVPILNWGGPTDAASGNIAAPNPSPTASAPDNDCGPLYQQVEVSNENNRVDNHFSDIINEAIAQPGSLDANVRDALLERSAQNGQLLATWTSAFGLHEDPNDWDQLVDGNCLSEEGQRLHAQFEGALKATGTSVAIGEAPANGYNSGVQNGTFGVEATPGVGGDRTAVVITMPDGTKVYIMVRCGNIVYEGKPPLPEVPTDNPKCPDGQNYNENGTCPKSNDPDDYRAPGDGGKGQDVGTGTKPKAPAPTTPAQPTPDPVETSKPGGGGVVDSPTNPPSSETGVTAPGATPPPTPRRRLPPNEGGDFDEPVPEPEW